MNGDERSDTLSSIKEMRLEYSLTQQGMSDKLGIPKRTIEDWECGRRTPPEYLVKLIEFYLKNN
jgi:DNA-binding transcriptional regulator YiaG